VTYTTQQFLDIITKYIMDLQDQLKNIFPEHIPSESSEDIKKASGIWIQDDPIICKYEKRKGKPITIIEGYTGGTEDFKTLAKELKKTLSVGGSFKDHKIIIQGDYRDKIMQILKDKGFITKRVGG
jgi:translation initiation factor 1